MDMLEHDQSILKEKYQEAFGFMIAASLRSEAYGLLCIKKRTGSLSAYQTKRLSELLESPACNQNLFLALTESLR